MLTTSQRNASPRADFSPRSWGSSKGRIVILSMLPLAAAGRLLYQAYYYFHTIPPGDRSFRGFVTGGCIVMALAIGASIVQIVARHYGSRIQIEAGRLIIRDGNALVSSDWGDVQLAPEYRRLGIRQVTVCVAGRPRVVDELFYPNFDEICASMRERVQAFDKAMRRSMVQNDWIKVG